MPYPESDITERSSIPFLPYFAPPAQREPQSRTTAAQWLRLFLKGLRWIEQTAEGTEEREGEKNREGGWEKKREEKSVSCVGRYLLRTEVEEVKIWTSYSSIQGSILHLLECIFASNQSSVQIMSCEISSRDFMLRTFLWKASLKKYQVCKSKWIPQKIDPGSSFILIDSNYAPRYEVGNKDSSATNEETLFPSFGNMKVTKEWQRLRESHFLLS